MSLVLQWHVPQEVPVYAVQVTETNIRSVFEWLEGGAGVDPVMPVLRGDSEKWVWWQCKGAYDSAGLGDWVVSKTRLPEDAFSMRDKSFKTKYRT